jgi:hypothetical protein
MSLTFLLANLGNRYLWQDEAQTALVSKTILTDGVPKGYDGKNYFSQEKGAEYGKNYIWRWHTWLPFYVLAGFYKVFGISTFVSRLPFALFGFGTVLMTYFLAKALWNNNRIAVIAGGLLAVSVPFLLMCRQCRYYSMVMFFSVLALLSYEMLLERRKYAAVLLFASMTLLFHSQQIYLPGLVAALLVHGLVFRRDRLKVLLVIIAGVAVVNGPWMAWLSGVNYPSIDKTRLFNPEIMLGHIKKFVTDIFSFIFPIWLLGFAAAAMVVRRMRTGRFVFGNELNREKTAIVVIFVIFNVFTMTVTAPWPYLRYLVPSIPLLIIFAAVVIDAAIEAHLLVGVAAILLFVGTGQLKDYLYEITHDYDGPEEGIAKYLNEHGTPDDMVVITYGDLPLKFYTSMRVIGGFTGEDITQAQKARWVIIRRHAVSEKDAPVGDYIFQKLNPADYRMTTIDYPDISFGDRENIDEHLFRTATTADKVVIYERIK